MRSWVVSGLRLLLGAVLGVVLVGPSLAVVWLWLGCYRVIDGRLVWGVQDWGYTWGAGVLFALGVWLASDTGRRG
jgi:hypothetical protein